MKKAWIRLAASVVLSALLVVGISASGILTNGHRTDGLFYQASGIRPDAELLTVNGETIDAEEYLYWLAYDCEYLAYNVQDLDFDAELSEGMTYGAYAKQDALETVKLYAVVRQWAKRGNVTLSDADRLAPDERGVPGQVLPGRLALQGPGGPGEEPAAPQDGVVTAQVHQGAGVVEQALARLVEVPVHP